MIRAYRQNVQMIDRLLQNADFPNFFVGKINLILGILHVCLGSN